LAAVKRRLDMHEVHELFRGVLFAKHGPFESRELAEMFVGHHDLDEPGVEFLILPKENE
jgi:hypothetical protein